MKEKIEKMFDEYNAKLNPAFSKADKEHIIKFTAKVVAQIIYEEAMDTEP